MKVSFIATVLNEESNIGKFLHSIFDQSRKADEVIIVDGGSTDRTVAKIKDQRSKIKDYKGRFLILSKNGNRAIGRNKAIRNASNEIVVCSDAGCILDRDWVKNIIEPFNDPKIDVVAGYYSGKPNSVFEKCLVPYALVMSDKVNDGSFLPASRSMAFRKSVWKKVGGFPEEFSNNEDYVFAKRLKKIHANITFKRNAIIYWTPRGNFKDAFIMFYRFAKGDSESHIFRPKVMLIFLRYLIVLFFIIFFLTFKSYTMLNVLYLTLIIYVLWSIVKNYKYVNDFRAIFCLPLIQFVSDSAVIMGTIKGFSFVKNKNGR